MMYPDDFKVSQEPAVAGGIKDRFGIMDGGVVDNQGIDPILLAEQRMSKYRADKTRTDKALDLIIVSDVSSPYMDGYEPSKQMIPQGVGKLTLGRLRNYGLISEAVAITLFIVSLVLGSHFWQGVMSVILAIVTLANIAGALFKSKMFTAIRKTFVGDRAAFVSHLKFATLEAMVMNRARSVVMMSSEVFLKRMRQLNYGRIYDDERWKNRSITNLIYELRAGQSWDSMTKNGTMPAYLAPSKEIQENSAKAANMGSTLWFTQEDKEARMPQALMAAGQYTICFNLIDYIDKIQKDPTNLSPAHQAIIALRPKLMEAWDKFKENPQWMLPK
jgi:hypothetical protein